MENVIVYFCVKEKVQCPFLLKVGSLPEAMYLYLTKCTQVFQRPHTPRRGLHTKKKNVTVHRYHKLVCSVGVCV